MVSGLKRHNTVIALEGLHGSGKSSIAKYLAEQYDMVRLESPMGQHFATRFNFEDSAPTVAERALFYMGANAEASEALEEHRANGRNIVMDGYYMPSLLMNGLRNQDEWVMRRHFEKLVQPDMWFYISIDYKTMQNNTQRRKWDNRLSLMDPRLRQNKAIFDRVNALYQENLQDVPHQIIDGNCVLDEIKKQVITSYESFKTDRLVKHYENV